ncbi:hypothetical protein D3C86_1913550 [compost metagenome]
MAPVRRILIGLEVEAGTNHRIHLRVRMSEPQAPLDLLERKLRQQWNQRRVNKRRRQRAYAFKRERYVFACQKALFDRVIDDVAVSVVVALTD